MRRLLLLAVLSVATAAQALPVDRGVVEEGTDTDGGVLAEISVRTTSSMPTGCLSALRTACRNMVQ